MKNVIIVQLRVYRGTKILKDESGKIENVNQTVTLKHDTQEWYNYISKMLRNGYGVVKVETAVYDKGLNKDYTSNYEDVEADKLKEIHEEVQKQLIKVSTIALTPEQKEIAELKATVAKLVEGSTPKVITPPVDDSDTDDIKALRDEYKELNPSGKAAFAGWKADVLKEKIEAFKS